MKVHIIESIFEMDMVKDALEEKASPLQLKNTKTLRCDGLLILQKGYVTLFVEEWNKKKVRTIVKRIKNLPYVAYSKD